MTERATLGIGKGGRCMVALGGKPVEKLLMAVD